MYIGRYIYTHIYICWTYLQEELSIFKWSVFTQHLLYISSTWLAKHRCLLYGWRSRLTHKFCPGAENKPTFSKFPSRAFFWCSALPPGALLLWLGRTKWYRHSATWEIAMLMTIRPRVLAQREAPEQMDQIFPSFLLHAIDVWFAATSLSHLLIILHQCGDNSRSSAPTYPNQSALVSLDLTSALTRMPNPPRLFSEAETVEATDPSGVGVYGCARKCLTVRLQQAGHLAWIFLNRFSLYLGMCSPATGTSLPAEHWLSCQARPQRSWPFPGTWIYLSSLQASRN